MKTTITVCALFAILLTGIGAVSAESISYTTGYSSSSTSGWNQTLQLNQFDATIGTLTQVILTLTGNISGTITLTNNAGSPKTGSGTLLTTFNLTMPDGSTLSSSPGFATGNISIGGHSTATTPFNNQVIQTANILDLTPFIGNGMVSYAVSANNNFNTAGNQISGSFTNLAGVNLQVEYDYVTPEPATLTLAFFGGLAAIGFARRSRRTQL